MSCNERIASFPHFLERQPIGTEFTREEVIRLAGRAGISFARASSTLDLLVARQEWRRVFLDAAGRPLSQDALAIGAAAWVWGFSGPRVAWRRCEREMVLAA